MKLATQAVCSSKVASTEALRAMASCSYSPNPSTGTTEALPPNMGSLSSSELKDAKAAGAPMTIPFVFDGGAIFYYGDGI